MKKITLLFSAMAALFFISCEGPQGPPGYDGLDGRDGNDGEPGIQAQIFEVDGVNLTYINADNVWETVLTFSDFTSFDVLKEDVILVYRWDNSIEFNDGQVADAWGLIPQNYFFEEGTMQYVSSHTLRDVAILIDGNFDLSNLNPDFTDNQLFRVAILPGFGASSAKIDTSSLKSVMKTYGITESQIKKIDF